MRNAMVVLTAVLTLALPALAQEATPTPEPVSPKDVTPLFNGKDLSGWKPHLSDASVPPEQVWAVKDGVLRCEGKPTGYIRTENAFKDYVLIVEWRWPQGKGNSGVLIHTQGKDEVWPRSIECQLESDNAGDLWVIGGTDFKEHTDKSQRRVANKIDGVEKPLGEWNSMRIVCNGNTVTVSVNDQEANKATETNVTNGAICLQSEGAPIEFRRVEIRPLEK